MHTVTRTLSSWGNTSSATSRVWLPTSAADVAVALQSAGHRGVIARGFGRSYGDACLNNGGDVIDITRLDRIHSFDADTGTLHCDAGVSYQRIMQECLPAGWMPAVCPGTAFVSAGGAIANDIHGKNQHVAGTISDHVDWLDLLTADGTSHRISARSDPDLFDATVGGIGLTGVITALQLRLARASSNAFELHQRRVPGIASFLELLASPQPDYPYAVGWIDALRNGRHLGRGILELARPADSGVTIRGRSARTVPFHFPRHALHRYVVRAFNAAYMLRVPAGGRTQRVEAERFLFPLDAVQQWNRVYGHGGLYQFQCVIPWTNATAITTILEHAARSRLCFLAVIKSFTRTGTGMLSFPTPGCALALDLPRRRGTVQLMRRLHDLVLQHGGRVYLAKDACLEPDDVRAMYPRLAQFRDTLLRVDPHGRMQSDMSRRLGLAAERA